MHTQFLSFFKRHSFLLEVREGRLKSYSSMKLFRFHRKFDVGTRDFEEHLMVCKWW